MKTLLCLLAALALLPAATLCQTTVDPLLIEALNQIEPGVLLDVTVESGSRHLGTYAGHDTTELRLQETAAPPAGIRPLQIPLAGIDRIQHRSSAAGKGFRTGFMTGAVMGGSLALLWGIALDSLDDQGGDVGAIAGFTMAGTLAGGLGLGILGSGVGALSHVWHLDYASARALPLSPAQTDRSDTRLGLGLGVATGYEKVEDFQATGFYGTAGLQKSLGPRVEFGPEIGYYDLDGTIRHDSYGYSYVTATSPILTIGLAGTLQSSRQGWSPYLILGSGYYIGGGEYLGASLGGGFKYRTHGQHDIKFEIRDHINIYDNGHDWHLDYFVTFGANFSFSL